MDSTVALRSLPRRFTELLSPQGDGRPEPSDDELARRREVVLEQAGAAAAEISMVPPALTRVLVEDDPVIDPTTAGQVSSGADAIDSLRTVTEQLAAAAEQTHGSQWTRTAMRAGEKITALDLLNEAVHAGVHHLRLASDSLT